jgi:molecular chaperone GrpE
MADREKSSEGSQLEQEAPVETGENDNLSTGSGVEAQEAQTEQAEEAPRLSQEELAEALRQAESNAEEFRDQALRAQAEMENLRRRAARDVESAHKYGLEKIAAELLPIKDSLEMGLNAARQTEQPDVHKVTEGVELTLKMFESALEKFAIKEINPQHQRFDPELHQAMSVQPSDEVEPNTVINVYQKGYMLNDRLLRPALVVVSQGGGKGADSSPEPEGGSKIDQMA